MRISWWMVAVAVAGCAPNISELPNEVIADTTRGGVPPVGTSPPPVPPAPSPLVILPGEDIQAKLDAQPAGTRFTIAAGTHRLQTIRPRDGVQLIGEAGAVLSGARVLTQFEREGSLWLARGQAQENTLAGQCEVDRPMCRQPEDLFIDNRRLEPVASKGEVAAGKWFFDRANDRAYFADDPTGRLVEVGVVPHAFAGAANGVVIQNITIEKYATPAQQGAVQGDQSHNWTLENVDVRLNHGTGIRLGEGMRVLRSRVVSNGQLGIGGSGSGILVESTEIAYNNAAGYKQAWEAGGTKFARTQDLVVRGNHVHHNAGHGLWTDIDNIRTLYELNRCEDNALSGIFHEISYSATIRENTTLRNGAGSPAWVDGAGILVNSSRDVEIYHNTVDGNANGIAAVQSARGTGRYGDYRVANLYVHDNVITLDRGSTGLVQNEGSSAVFQDSTNRFRNNRYTIGYAGRPFAWNDRTFSFSQWQALGHDQQGSASTP